jgi:class 3 adenylate cyclase/pimeloyl-ACP methyl ester carboxylesterase
MQPPPVRFAALGGDRIAYQAIGTGSVPLLLMRAHLVSLETIWEHPAHLRLWRAIGERTRAVTFDFRGLGVSDPVPDEAVGDLDAAVADALAVMDAVGMDRACVSGEFDSAAVAVALAVRHPERVDKLMLVNGFAKGCAGEGYEFGLPLEFLQQLADEAPDTWGSGSLMAMAAPHIADDPAFAARIERIGARPRAAAAILRRNAALDLRDMLPGVDVPTLVVHTGDVSTTTPEQSRHLAAHIRGAQLFEAESSTFYWGGGAVDAMLDFLTGESAGASDHDLATVLFTDVVGSTDAVATAGDREWRQTLDFLDDLTTSRASRHGGRVVHHTGDGHLLAFSRPRDAVDAALSLVREARVLGIGLRAGLHAGEVERRESGDIGGLTVHIAARVAALADADEVLVSRTVVDLLGATEHAVTPRGIHELRGVPGTWSLFAVSQ